ncbi:MAG TPA: hypothetical protein PKE31_08605 [Pseudomonadota bacterium]|jgi:hypothetical protein|nr:hypothetical protein [Pseudomonadota bacterium]
MKPTCVLLFSFAVFVAGCTETSKAWVRPDTTPEVVEQQKHLCKVWSEGQVGWRAGLSADEKSEMKSRVEMFFRECMTLNRFKEEESTIDK